MAALSRRGFPGGRNAKYGPCSAKRACPACAVVTIDWVTIGDPGNAAQSAANRTHSFGSGGDGSGAVDYVYRISRNETTIAQYTAFLNAVATTDPYGFYNTSMAGNVWEWNDLSGVSGLSRGLRGGSWGTTENGLLSSFRIDFDPSNANDYIGFRLASIPEPSTVLLGLLPTACLLRRRRNHNA